MVNPDRTSRWDATVPFSDEELVIVYSAVREAAVSITKMSLKTQQEISGEMFTKLRSSKLRGHFPSLFSRGRMKFCRYRDHEKWQFIERIARHMLNERKDIEERSADEMLVDLRVSLAAMNTAIEQLTQVNLGGEKVMRGIAEINNIVGGSDGR
jgi:hypothetical protein